MLLTEFVEGDAIDVEDAPDISEEDETATLTTEVPAADVDDTDAITVLRVPDGETAEELDPN